MSDIQTRKLVYSDEYAQILNEARRWTRREGAKLTTTRHLFWAAANLFPEIWKEALGRPLFFPDFETFDAAGEESGTTEERGEAFDEVCLSFGRRRDTMRSSASAEFARVLSPYGGGLAAPIAALPPEEPIGATHVVAALLLEAKRDVADFLRRNGIEDKDVKRSVNKYLARLSGEERDARRRVRVGKCAQAIRERLEAATFGQTAAIDEIVSALTNFWLQSPEERGGRPATIVLLGGSGTGKTTLSEALQEAVAEALKIEKIQKIDMTAFQDPQTALDLIGRDESWRGGGREGELTLRAKKEPKGPIVLENLEMASVAALTHVANAVERGELVDEFTNETVSFAGNVLLLVSRAGAEFLESDEYRDFLKRRGNEESVPRGLLRDALSREGGEAERRGYASSASALAGLLDKADAVVALKKHNVETLTSILTRAVFPSVAKRLEALDVVWKLDQETERRLVAFLLETQDAGFGSIRDMLSQTETFLFSSVRTNVLASNSPTRFELRLEIDDWPELGARFDGETLEPYSTPWVAARTRKRQMLGKRLAFSSEVEREGDVLTLKATALKYETTPSVEDFGWFSATPADASFADLVGVDVARQSVERALDYLRDPKGFGLRPELGVLLVGPPGTGKTSLAKAFARELEVPLIAINGPDLSSPERVAAVFRAARKYGAVVFIDEIDSVGSRGVYRGADAIVNALLTELDGFKTRERPTLVVAATNRIDVLDAALLRPGRFGRIVRVENLKNPKDRSALIDLLCERSKTGIAFDETTKNAIVEMTDGASPALMTACVREALWAAFCDGRSTVSQSDFVEAFQTTTRGVFTRLNRLDEEERRVVATHEAGHALVAWRRGLKVTRASIAEGGNVEGAVGYVLKKRARREGLLAQIDVALAGFAAERFRFGGASVGSESDFELATRFALTLRRAGLDGTDRFAALESDDAASKNETRREIDALLKERMDALVDELRVERGALEALASALQEREILFENDLREILERLDGQGNARPAERCATLETRSRETRNAAL